MVSPEGATETGRAPLFRSRRPSGARNNPRGRNPRVALRSTWGFNPPPLRGSEHVLLRNDCGVPMSARDGEKWRSHVRAMLERLFRLREHRTTVRVELL